METRDMTVNFETERDRGFNYTPIFNGVRVQVRARFLPTAKHGKISVRKIEDLDTHKVYRVYVRACSLPNCMCDAEIKETV